MYRSFLVDHATYIVRELGHGGIYNVANCAAQHLCMEEGGEPERLVQIKWAINHHKGDWGLNKMLEQDDEVIASDMHRLFAKKISMRIPASTILRFLRLNLKWVVVRARTGPMISDKHKKHIEFTGKCISDKDIFDNVVWTDESYILLVRHTRYVRVKVGKERNIKPTPKHAVKVHVWAGILKQGVTKICIFDQIMNAEVYVDILIDCLVPFLQERA